MNPTWKWEGQKIETHLFPRTYTIDPSCFSRDQTLINAELDVAASMASYAQANLDSTTGALYTSAFIQPDLISSANIITQLANEYGNVAAMKDGFNYEFTVTCEDTNKHCAEGYFAFMTDTSRNVGTMNLCSAWFEITGTPAAKLDNIQNLVSTVDIISGCKATPPRYNNLDNIWWGRGQSLLHEWTHTRYFTGSSSKTLDFAYGVQGCLNLAAGSHSLTGNRAWKIVNDEEIPRCPSKEDPKKPGICNPYLSIDNADTLSIIAGGLWYSDKSQCNRVLPIGLVAAAPPTHKQKIKRQDTSDDENEVALDPPFDGDDFVPISHENPDSNGCCGEFRSITSAITPASEISTSSSSFPSKTGSLSCLMHEDLDEGTLPTCQCSNGVNISPVFTIKVTDAQYNSTDYLDIFINMIASTVNATAMGLNCKLLEWEEIIRKKWGASSRDGQQEITMESRGAKFCHRNGFLGAQLFNGIQEMAKLWFETKFGFDLGELGNFDCASTIDLVEEVLGHIFDAISPGFTWLIEMGVKLGEIACRAAKKFNPRRLLRRH